MATATLIPVSEYLSTSYHPDCDYVDGELRERNVGEQPHSSIQILLGSLFHVHRHEWQIRALSEQRVQVTASRFRIPDLCIVRRSDQKEPIITKPPLLCIEILSKNDTLKELQERVNDYSAMGVAHIWAVDPVQRIGYVASPRGFIQPDDGILNIPNTPISLKLSDIFNEMDEM